MIRKFKHNQTGYIATNDALKGYYRITSNGVLQFFLENKFIENSNDWKEVKEPKYQILAFQHPENGNLYKLLPNGTYGYPKVTGYYNRTELNIPYEECLKRYPIHSVKRLKDGVIFKFKDKIKLQSVYTFEIERIVFYGEEVCFVSKKNFGAFTLDNAELVKEQPLMATVTITFSDNRPKQTQKLEQGDSLLIKF